MSTETKTADGTTETSAKRKPQSMKAHITVSLVRKLKPNSIQWDADKVRSDGTVFREGVRGFGVRRQRSDLKTYFLCYRLNGRQRWLTIGAHGDYTPEQARERANKLRGQIADAKLFPKDRANKFDPATIRDDAKRVPTVQTVAADYLEQHVKAKLKPRTAAHYIDAFKRFILPALGKHQIDAVTRDDAARLHHSLKDTPYQANRVLGVISSLFSWCEQTGRRPQNRNPASGIKRYAEMGRERYLGTEELGRLGKVLAKAEADGTESVYTIAALRLLVFTGARLSEILTLKWSYVDLERGLLSLPDSKTGKKQIHLNAPARAVLSDLPRVAGNPYCIVGAKPGSHRVNLDEAWARTRKAADLSEVRLHDLRHSYASFGAADGASLQLIGRLLGHSRTSTTERYSHLSADPVRQANERIGKKLEAAMGGTVEDGEFVELKRRA